MVVETTKNQIILNQKVGQKKVSRQVETDCIVNDVKPDVLNVINTNGVVNIYKKDIMDGKIRIDGAINTYIIYLADDNESTIRSLNTSLDFTEIIDMDNAKENMDSKIEITVKSFDTKIINGRKLNIKANLDISVTIYSNEACDVITGVSNAENFQILNSTQKITSLVGKGSSKVSAKDTIAIDTADELAEIMNVNIDIVDEEIKISYNKVLSKADARIEIMYLTEDNRINTASTKIPIMGFVDIQNINENCDCEAQNCLSNLVVKPDSTEHSISVDAEIEVICAAYETKQIDVIEDLYSITSDVKFDKKEINSITDRNKINSLHTLNENIRIPELTGRVLDIQTKPTINSAQIRNGKIIYEGNLNLTILFEQKNAINARNVDLPFSHDASSDRIGENSNIDTVLKIKQNDFIVKDGVIEVAVGIEFIISEQKSQRMNMIEEISLEESKECCNYSMIIYFVKLGDTLWKIAKMFKSTVEDIARLNNIEDVNKLTVSQQLYIPRFCKSRVTS